MEQVKIDVKSEIEKLDKSLAILKIGIKETKLSKKDKKEIAGELQEMIILLESTKE